MGFTEQAKTLWDTFAQQKKMRERQLILKNLVIAAYDTSKKSDILHSLPQKTLYDSTDTTIKVLIAIQNYQYNDPVWDSPSVMRDLAFLFIRNHISESCFLQGLFSVMMRQKIAACEKTQSLLTAELTADDQLTPEAERYLDQFVKLLKSELFRGSSLPSFNINKNLLVELLKQLPRHEVWLGSYDLLQEKLNTQTLSTDILSISAVYTPAENKHYYLLPSLAVLDAILLSIPEFSHQPYLPFHTELSVKELMDAEISSGMRPVSFVLEDITLVGHNQYLNNADLLIHDLLFHIISIARKRKNLPDGFQQEMHWSAELNNKFGFEFTSNSWSMHDTLTPQEDIFFMAFLLFKGLSSTKLPVTRPSLNIELYKQALTTNSIWKQLSESKKLFALYVIYGLNKEWEVCLPSMKSKIKEFLTELAKESETSLNFVRNHLKNPRETDVALQIQDNSRYPINRLRMGKHVTEQEFAEFVFYYYMTDKGEKSISAHNSFLFSDFIVAKKQPLQNSIQDFIKETHIEGRKKYASLLYLIYGEVFILQIQALATDKAADFRSILPTLFRLFPGSFCQWINANNVLEVTTHNNDHLSLGDIFNKINQDNKDNFIENAHKGLAAYVLPETIVDNYQCNAATAQFLCLMRCLLENKQPVYFSEINMLAKIIREVSAVFNLDAIFPFVLWDKIPQTLNLDHLEVNEFVSGIKDFLKSAFAVKTDVKFAKIILDKVIGHMHIKFPECSPEVYNLIAATKDNLTLQVNNKPKISYLETLASQIKQQMDLKNQPTPQ
jgi:hypothetical protein